MAGAAVRYRRFSDALDESESESDSESPIDFTEEANAKEKDPSKQETDIEGSEKTSWVRRIVQNAARETHYVIVVHGTFDPPKPSGPRPWYFMEENPHNFCHILASNLKETHMGFESVWRELPSDNNVDKLPSYIEYPFYWDGGNTHESRCGAGKTLALLVNSIGKKDPSARIHLVAHSHGGNVVLKAIQKYLTILRKETMKSYSNEITDEFWSTHKDNYEAIKLHQAVKNAPWYTKFLGPFAVFKRKWVQEEGLGELYYGYWPITDRLLGYPRYRQRKYLRKKWAESASTNALGHIVFMGTPFYSKFWERNAWVFVTLNLLLSSAVVFLVLIAAIIIARYFIAGNVPILDFNLDPMVWLLAAVASMGFVAASSLTGKRYTEGNLYLTESKSWSPAMKALVLNAGKLDEAALALSTEPLVRAYLMPQVKAMLRFDPWSGLKPFPSYSKKSSIRNAYSNFWLVIWNIVFSVPYLFLGMLNYLLVPWFSNTLLRLFIDLGFGLQKNEVDYAQVYVEEYLRLTPDIHDVTHWNVQRILASAPREKMPELTSSVGAEELDKEPQLAAAMKLQEEMSKDSEKIAAERWRFMWDNEELEQRAAASETLHRLKDQIGQMRCPPRATRFAFERELKLLCVTLEERFKEMAGSMDQLSHGSYFRNRIIIAAISHFLASGELPAWAGKLGDVHSPP